jgi:hypothetical protein
MTTPTLPEKAATYSLDEDIVASGDSDRQLFIERFPQAAANRFKTRARFAHDLGSFYALFCAFCLKPPKTKKARKRFVYGPFRISSQKCDLNFTERAGLLA